MRIFSRSCLLWLLFVPVSAFSQTGSPPSTQPDCLKASLERLASLTVEPIEDWRSSADISRPEALSTDDADWDRVIVANPVDNNAGNRGRLWMGARVFRRTLVIPPAIHGYATDGSRVFLDLYFGSKGILLPGNLSVTIFSNGSILYRGMNDNLQPVLVNDHAIPGERYLIAARVVGDDDVQSEFQRSILTIEPPSFRPNPEQLRTEILAARAIGGAYEEGRAARESQIRQAVAAIDFSTLDHGDQQGFDASLNRSREKLKLLEPFLKQFSIRAVGNAHIDMAWLWSWTETVEVVRNTFRSVLDLMREYPDFKFTMSSARAYEWIQEKYPEMFQQIQQRVKEGRWEIVGGMWVEPDLNMPAGESLVRQLLIGKRYFQKNFGVDVHVGWNPDSFGYNWQLPQIYKKSGIDYFVTQKLLWAHEFTTFPYKLFWWQSPDGSRLLTYFPHDYGGGIDQDALGTDLAAWLPSIYGQSTANHPEMMHLYGVGDHGGGPTRTMLDHATELTRPNAIFPEFQFSTASDFFAHLEAKLPSMNVPVWNGELYFQYHRGVFTTQAETKRRIRQSESRILNSEQIASVATMFGMTYPSADLELAWKNLLFDHFHDVMPGSGVAINYVEAQRNLEDVDRITSRVTDQAITEIAAHIHTEGPGVPLVVFNTLSWERTDVVELEAQLPEAAKAIEVTDGSGRSAESQVLSMDDDTHRVRFLLIATVPSLGYKTYFVRGVPKAVAKPTHLNASPTSLENEFFRLQIDPADGCMVSLVVKKSGRDVLAPSETDTGGPKNKPCGNLLQAFVDRPKLYGIWNLDAWNIDANFENQFWNLDKPDSVELIESGNVRSILRIKNHFQNSTFVRDITVFDGVQRIDVKMQADWHEKHILLKVAFPTSAHSEKATFEIPFGSVERPTTRRTPAEQAQFEVPALRWADLSDNRQGLSILNDCKYGYDAKGNVLRLSLLRSPDFPDPHADEGHHEFTYALLPHDGTWKDALTVRRGYELNVSLLARQTFPHAGSLPAENSFFTVQGDNVVVTAVKKAEDVDALLLRFYEWAGDNSRVTITLPSTARDVRETNLMEKITSPIEFREGKVHIPVSPYTIRTIVFDPGTHK